jgi:hypothetical protein
MVFNLVDGPDGALDVLHPHEALVQRQVVSHSVLRLTKKISINIVERRLYYGANLQGKISFFRLKILLDFWTEKNISNSKFNHLLAKSSIEAKISMVKFLSSTFRTVSSYERNVNKGTTLCDNSNYCRSSWKCFFLSHFIKVHLLYSTRSVNKSCKT